MKKLFLILVLGLLAVFANAQLATLDCAAPKTGIETQATYVLTNTTAAYVLFNAPQHYKTTQDFTVTFHKASGTPTRVNVVLYGQKTVDTPWVSIATGFWKVTSADTVMTISNATANRYRNYKVLYTPVGTGTSNITKQVFKLYLE